jgi:hypothetical protein
MPKVFLHERHFELMRALLRGFLQEHEDDPAADTAEELLTVLGYSRHFHDKPFTVEISASNDNGHKEVRR